MKRAVRETPFSSFQLCSDCEIHTIAPFSLKGGRRGATAARPAISWAQRGRVHSGDKGARPGGLVGSRVSHPAGAGCSSFCRCISRGLCWALPGQGVGARQVRRPAVPSARPEVHSPKGLGPFLRRQELSLRHLQGPSHTQFARLPQ